MKTKILHIQVLPILSGVQNMMLSLLESLDKDKYDIYVACKPGGELVDKIKRNGYIYLPLNHLRREICFNDIIAFFEIYSYCRKYKFDIVHLHSSKLGFIGRIAAKLAGIKKIFFTSHGTPFHIYQPYIIQKVYQILETVGGYFGNKTIFVNNYDRDFYIKNKMINNNKALTIYNGVKIPPKQKIFKRKNGITIGYVGRFSKQKNIIKTVLAAIKVCNRNDDFDFIFVGDGELYPIATKMVKDNNLQKRIKLVGWQNDILNWLDKFDVFLLFSKWEGLPLSILDAMAYGLPIIASDIKGNRELVNKDCGILIDPNDIESLVEVILNFENNFLLMKEMGNNSRKYVSKNFSFENFIGSYKKIYEEV
jgi:glycosyltransferase involved in cell wall biosynthesis